MEGMEEKLNSILSNPQMMAQIMSMAQAFGSAPTPPPEKTEQPVPPAAPVMNFDPAMLQKVVGMAQQTGIDKNQQSLLHALIPYLSNERITRLENAMRAAKIAALTTSFFGANGLPFFSGR